MYANFKRTFVGFIGTAAAALCLVAATAPAISTAAPVAMFAATTLTA